MTIDPVEAEEEAARRSVLSWLAQWGIHNDAEVHALLDGFADAVRAAALATPPDTDPSGLDVEAACLRSKSGVLCETHGRTLWPSLARRCNGWAAIQESRAGGGLRAPESRERDAAIRDALDGAAGAHPGFNTFIEGLEARGYTVAESRAGGGLDEADVMTLVNAVLGGTSYLPHREAAERVRAAYAKDTGSS